MATSNLEVQSLPVADSTVHSKKIVNDFAINVATVNGSGSQSANSILLRSIFNMGVPVSGKNLFPSNIAGLPTWYLIRASRDGWVARKGENDLLIAMNPETVHEDIRKLPSGRCVIFDEAFNLTERRDDIIITLFRSTALSPRRAPR
jgi:2-oxoglutarate ferredoxin oxidoreductase subunit alpha